MLFASQIYDFLRKLPSRRLKKEKEEMRMIMRQRMQRMSAEDRIAMSEQICRRLRDNDIFREAKVVMMFYPILNEPDVRPLMEEFYQSKTILLPVAHRKDIEMRRYTGKECLHRGKFGIPEPRSNTFTGAPDLIILPGVAFDKKANRLGRGGGYYDRFLHHFHHVHKFAVAYDFQIVDKVPMAHSDVQLDAVFTVGTEFVRK